MQIPLEHMKTMNVSRPFRVLVMQYIQRCGNGEDVRTRLMVSGQHIFINIFNSKVSINNPPSQKSSFDPFCVPI